jgi:hypothetical protein
MFFPVQAQNEVQHEIFYRLFMFIVSGFQESSWEKLEMFCQSQQHLRIQMGHYGE